MKLFRKITALVLTLVVIAMLGISASAASFSESVPGDFGVGVGAMFNGSLTSSTARGTATFYGVGEDIELVEQEIKIDFTRVHSGTFAEIDDEAKSTVRGNTVIVAEGGAGSPYYISRAYFNYNATYIANGVVDCYISCGPKVLYRS